MASTISAGTSAGTAIAIAGDTTGNLAFTTQAGANTITVPNSTGTILTTGSPQSGGVIQVVQASYSTQVSNSTSTLADTGVTLNITPKFSTSKVLAIITGEMYKSNGNAINSVTVTLNRSGSTVYTLGNLMLYTGSASENSGSFAGNYLDSPATTSSITYKVQFKNELNASQVAVQFQNMPTVLTLMEIAV